MDTKETEAASSTTSTQYREGDDGHSEGATSNVVSHHENTVTKRVPFSDQGQDNEIQSDSPDSSTTQPDEWQMPDNIDLDSSGLRRSTCSAVLGQREQVYSHSTISLKAQIKQNSKKSMPGSLLFSSFCSIGSGLKWWVHSHQVLVQSSSRLTHAIESYHRVNSLYDGTIICFSTWRNLARHRTKLSTTSKLYKNRIITSS